MNPLIESLLVPEGATWTYFHRVLHESIPFNWHRHPEVELTLTLNSVGQRYVGDSIETYGDGDLVLVGSNLPHTWMSQRKLDAQRPHVAHVFWIRGEWLLRLIDSLAELTAFKALLAGAGRGVVFSAPVAAAVRSRVERMASLSPARQLAVLVEVMSMLIEDTGARLLSAPREGAEPLRLVDRPRIDRTLAYI